MKRLYVLYDEECALCRRCRAWLARQPAFVPLALMPLQSPEAECRFPELGALHPEREMVVIGDEGSVWQGAAAWVMCLWALREYREWALRLAQPALLPLARQLCHVVSTNRQAISRWLLGAKGHVELRTRLESYARPRCDETGACRA